MFKILLLFVFINIANASSIFVPDSDTAILIELLGTEIQATAGILQIVNQTSDTIEKIEEVHRITDDHYTKAVQAEYYVNVLLNFRKNKERIRSISTLKNNLARIKGLYDNKRDLTLGYNVLERNNQVQEKLIRESIRKNAHDRKLATQYLRSAGKAKSLKAATSYSAKSNALSSLKLSDINSELINLNTSNTIENVIKTQEKENEHYLLYLKQKRWGMVPNDLTYSKYNKVNKNERG